MDNTQKFSSKAGEYAKYRPKYSQEYIEYLTEAVIAASRFWRSLRRYLINILKMESLKSLLLRRALQEK